MSRKSRASRRTATATAPVAAAPLAGPASQFSVAGSGFDGANFSTRRGYIYFPTLETRREVDSYSRLELIRRARWLKRNTGFTKRCINGISNMVGHLTPRALTRDAKWNAAAERLWRTRAGSPSLFDLSGRFNVDGYQTLLTRSRLLDGDILSVFTDQSGGAAVMTYEAHQVAQGNREPGVDGWRDGVNTGPHARPRAFSVIDNFETGSTVDIPASDCVLHCDYDSFGWQRGPSALHHAINHLLDSTEIISDLKLGIKTANRIGYYEYSPNPGAVKVPGAGDVIARNQQVAKAPKGGNVLLEDTFRGGKIPQLDNGREIKQLLDERPHPNSREFLEHLNRDIAWGLGMSSDVLWNIAKLGGASVRYVLADAQTFLETQQQLLVDQFLTRFWIYFCAREMEAGRLDLCDDPEWWVVGWLPPAKLTVDISRDGKLSIDLHRAGMLTMKRWYGMQGLDDEEEDRQRVEEYARRLVLCQEIEARYRAQGKEIRIDPERVFPTAVPGAAPATPSNGRADLGEIEPGFGEPEQFQQIHARLEDLERRFGAAA